MKRKLVSRNFRIQELPLLFNELRVGDLLEFKRKSFSHWAVYIGVEHFEGMDQHCIIHRSLPTEINEHILVYLTSRSLQSKYLSNFSSMGGEFSSIQIDSIVSAFGNDDPKDVVCINNQLDERWPPFTPEDIVSTAKALMYDVEQEPYNLATNNCEHFATTCRYGRKFSRQIARGLFKVASSVVGLAMSVAAKKALKAAMPVLISTAAAAGIPVGSGAIALIRAAPTIAGLMASATPVLAHAIESHKNRQ